MFRALPTRVAAALAILVVTALPAVAHADDDVYGAIADAFPNQPNGATRVAACESGLNPWATAEGYDRYYGYYRDVGLFQIDPELHQWRANSLYGPGTSLYDPWVNAHVAAWIQREYGWGAWPVCGLRA